MTAPASRPRWSVGDLIRKARRDAGMEQADLAHDLEVARSTLSAWENGHGEPSVSQWWRIADVTNANWLLSRESHDSHIFWQPGLVVGDGQARLDFSLPPSLRSPDLALV